MARASGRLGFSELETRRRDRSVDRIQDGRQGRCDIGGNLTLASTNDSASRRFGGSRGLALALAFQLLHTRLSGANPLTERFDLEPRPHLVLPRTLECLEKPVASRCVEWSGWWRALAHPMPKPLPPAEAEAEEEAAAAPGTGSMRWASRMPEAVPAE